MKLLYAFLLIFATYLLFPLHCVMADSLFTDPKSGGHGLLFMLNFIIGIALLGGATILLISFTDENLK